MKILKKLALVATASVLLLTKPALADERLPVMSVEQQQVVTSQGAVDVGKPLALPGAGILNARAQAGEAQSQADMQALFEEATKLTQIAPLSQQEMSETEGAAGSYFFRCTNCGAPHGGVYSRYYCMDCWNRGYGQVNYYWMW